MKRTFHIDDSHENAEAFINFLKTLKFVSFEDDSMTFELSEEQKKELDRRREAYLKGDSKTTSWKNIKETVRSSR